MNTKKGGSLASNHVHRLLKGDCKKGGKRSRAKKSKSKSKSKSKKSKKRTKKPKLVKRKKRTRNKKTKKKMKGGKIKCNGEVIDIRDFDDLMEKKKYFITCPQELLNYLKKKPSLFSPTNIKRICVNVDDLQKSNDLIDYIGTCLKIYLLRYFSNDFIIKIDTTKIDEGLLTLQTSLEQKVERSQAILNILSEIHYGITDNKIITAKLQENILTKIAELIKDIQEEITRIYNNPPVDDYHESIKGNFELFSKKFNDP
jgi:hypothetical protein